MPAVRVVLGAHHGQGASMAHKIAVTEIQITQECDALSNAHPASEKVGHVKVGSLLVLLREDDRDYYKVAFEGRPVFVPKSCGFRVESHQTQAQPSEGAARLADLLLGFVAVVVSASLAGVFVGAYWHAVGLLIGPSYWGLYLGSLGVALLVGRRWLALGMLAALLVAVPAFFGVAVLAAIYASLGP